MTATSNPEIRNSFSIGLLSEWLRQGVDTFWAAQRVAVDLLVRRNASAAAVLREMLSSSFPFRGGFLTQLVGEAVSGVVRAQQILLETAVRQNEILITAFRERTGDSRAEAAVNLLGRCTESFMSTQQELLGMARNQADAWAQPSGSGQRAGDSSPAELARKVMESLARGHEDLLRAVSDGTAGLFAGGRKSGTRPVRTEVTDLVRQSAHSLIDMHKRLLDLAGGQLDATLKTAGRIFDFAPPRLDPNYLFALLEILLLHLAPVYYGFGVPHGDNSGVVLIPGFLSTDLYLVEMYGWLKRLGYRPYFSGIGVNAECPNLLIRGRLNGTVQAALSETGRKVHLIGHSLGGIIARSVAAQRPDDIASVITLGSPFRGGVTQSSALQAAEFVRKHILLEHGPNVLPDCYTGHCSCEFVDHLRRDVPSSVAQTAIYTKNDEVVSWRYCVAKNPDVNFAAPGSHIALPFNTAAYEIIAHRLADARKAGTAGSRRKGHKNAKSRNR